MRSTYCIPLLLLVLLAGCERRNSRAATTQPTAVPVTLVPVRVEPVQRGVEVVGTLFGDEDVTISAKVAGRIAAIYKDLGDRAVANEPLAQIETTDYTLALRQKELALLEQLAKLGLRELPGRNFKIEAIPTVQRAKLQADNALAKFNRGKQLHEAQPPLISDQDYADLRTAWEVAQSNYDVELLTARSVLAEAEARQAERLIAFQRLEDATVRAPVGNNTDGATTLPAQGGTTQSARTYAVAARMVSQGEYVREGTALYRLVDDDLVKLRAAVPERHVAAIALGQVVQARVEAYPQETFTGTVKRINPQIDPANRTFQIEAEFTNPKHLLKPGAFARATVLTHQDPRVVFAPLEAVVSFAGTDKLFTVENTTAVEHIIETGLRRGEWVEVSGLHGDEAVVTRGASKLARGVKVVVKQEISLTTRGD